MNATAVETGYRPVHEGTSLKTMASGAILEGIGGIGVIALAIVGLAGVFPTPLAAIATIVLGAAMLIEGGAFAVSHRELIAGESSGTTRVLEWNEGWSADFLGALAGIILGVLALLGVAPLTLISVAALVFGTTFSATGMTRIGTSNRAMLGLAGFVLSLLAVCGLGSLTLVLVALLCLGTATLFSGALTGSRTATRAI